MTLVAKILNSFSHEQKVLYGNAFDLNAIVENVKIDNEGIVLIQEIQQSTLQFDQAQRSWCEKVDILMFFLTLSVYDRDSVQNEDLIDKCKKSFVRWLLQFPANNNVVRPVGDIKLIRVYEKTDTILTGIAAEMTLKEEIGTNSCNVTPC